MPPTYTHNNMAPAVRVFPNGPGDLGSIPGRVIPKTLKMVLDTTLLNTQHYKVRFKGKVEQSWEWSSAPPLHLGVVAIEKGAFGSPSTMVANFTFFITHTNTRTPPTHTHTLTITRQDSNEIPTVFDCFFSIFDSFHFVNCQIIIVL